MGKIHDAARRHDEALFVGGAGTRASRQKQGGRDTYQNRSNDRFRVPLHDRSLFWGFLSNPFEYS